MIRRPPRSTRVRSSAASDVYKRQCQNPDVLSLSSSAQSSSPWSLSSSLSPNFLLAGYSPNPSFQLSPSSFFCNSPISSSPVTSAPETSASMSTPPICSVSPSRSSPITSVKQHEGARLAAGNSFPFRPDRSDDYLYLYFLYHAVNSSHSTPELQQRLPCMEASFRSYLVVHGYPQALEASVGDLLLSHFVHVINLVGDRDRNLPLP